jgi:hypothetical protein
MDYLFQDGGKPKKTKSKTKTGTKTGTKTTKSKTSTKTGTKTTKSKTSTKTGSKTTKSKTGSKKGGNFLGAVGDLVAPTGWGPFATAAALVGLDRVDAALRRGKSTKSSAKKGGMRGEGETPVDEYIENYKGYLLQYPEFQNSLEKTTLLNEDLRYLEETYFSTLSDKKLLANELKKLKNSVNFSKLTGNSDLTKLNYIGKYFLNPLNFTMLRSDGTSFIPSKKNINSQLILYRNIFSN